LPKQHLLVADADPESLRVLEVSLRNAGFTVTTAASGPEALERCRVSRPDLVLSDVELPGLDGFELCRAVRGDARLRETPFIFLTHEKRVGDKLRGLELGVEEFLAKPVFVREALTRVKLLLDRRARLLLAGSERVATSSGDLAELGVVDLVQTLAAGRKTALVRVTRAGGGAGTMRFRDGRLVSCEAGRLRREPAFYRLLRWRDGRFAVELGGAGGGEDGAIQAGMHELLLEGMRRLGEWGRVVEGLPPLDRAFQIDYRLLSDRLAEIPDDVNGLLKVVDGRRTLEEVIEAAPDRDDLATATVLSKLYFEGIIVPAPPRDSRGGAVVEGARAHSGATPAPERVDWFAGPAGAEAAPPPLSSGGGRAPEVPPRIVRFPAKPRGTAASSARLETPVPGPVAGGEDRVSSSAATPAPPTGAAESARASEASLPAARAEGSGSLFAPLPGNVAPNRRGRRLALAVLALALAVLAVAALAAGRARTAAPPSFAQPSAAQPSDAAEPQPLRRAP
jgi:CheY-like chemotaxis protein